MIRMLRTPRAGNSFPAHTHMYSTRMATPDISAGDLPAILHERGFLGVPLEVNAVGHFEVAAEVNGHAARLVLDTGASHTVLDAPSAERLGLTTTASDDRVSGVGASDWATAMTSVSELRLGAVRLHDVTVRTLDLAHVNRALEARGGTPVDGAIGGDLLRACEAVIDYARATLYLRQAPPTVAP